MFDQYTRILQKVVSHYWSSQINASHLSVKSRSRSPGYSSCSKRTISIQGLKPTAIIAAVKCNIPHRFESKSRECKKVGQGHPVTVCA